MKKKIIQQKQQYLDKLIKQRRILGDGFINQVRCMFLSEDIKELQDDIINLKLK